MLDLTGLSAISGLFKDALTFRDRKAEHRQVFLEKVLSPLIEQLTPVAQMYHDALAEFATSIRSDNCDLHDAVAKLQSKRDQIVFLRDGIVSAFNGIDLAMEEKPQDDFRESLFRLCAIVWEMFVIVPTKTKRWPWGRKPDVEMEEFREMLSRTSSVAPSQASAIVYMARELQKKGYDSIGRDRLQSHAQMSLELFEMSWRTINRIYSELKTLAYRT